MLNTFQIEKNKNTIILQERSAIERKIIVLI